MKSNIVDAIKKLQAQVTAYAATTAKAPGRTMYASQNALPWYVPSSDPSAPDFDLDAAMSTRTFEAEAVAARCGIAPTDRSTTAGIMRALCFQEYLHGQAPARPVQPQPSLEAEVQRETQAHPTLPEHTRTDRLANAVLRSLATS